MYARVCPSCSRVVQFGPDASNAVCGLCGCWTISYPAAVNGAFVDWVTSLVAADPHLVDLVLDKLRYRPLKLDDPSLGGTSHG